MKLFKVALTFVLVAVAATLAMGMEEVNKTYNKEYQVTDNSSIYIQNRFGQVNIENWDKDMISFFVEVKVDHPDRDKAQRMLNAINVTFSQEDDKISAITSIEEKMMDSWNNFGLSSKELSINYKVKMPKHLSIELVNKYGDIFINELTGATFIDLKYGNLKANKIVRGNSENINSLTIGYGNASIDETEWFKIDIKYGSLSIIKSKALVVVSKYSKITVDEASSIVSESKYDTFRIGTVTNFVSESGYTNYNFSEVRKKLDITTKYGDVRIDRVSADFESINFRGNYASIYAGISASASYNLTGHVAYGGIKYNENNRVSRIEGNTKIEVSGLVGSNANTKSTVNVTVKYGSAKL